MTQDRPPDHLIEAVEFFRTVNNLAVRNLSPEACKFVLQILYEANINLARQQFGLARKEQFNHPEKAK